MADRTWLKANITGFHRGKTCPKFGYGCRSAALVRYRRPVPGRWTALAAAPRKQAAGIALVVAHPRTGSHPGVFGVLSRTAVLGVRLRLPESLRHGRSHNYGGSCGHAE